MILSDSSCQLLIDRWCSGVGPFWYARLEKVGGVGTHLVLIGEHMGAPLLKFVDTAPAFGMLNRHPVTVQIKPVVVGSAVRPHFVELRETGSVTGVALLCMFAQVAKRFSPSGLKEGSRRIMVFSRISSMRAPSPATK